MTQIATNSLQSINNTIEELKNSPAGKWVMENPVQAALGLVAGSAGTGAIVNMGLKAYDYLYKPQKGSIFDSLPFNMFKDIHKTEVSGAPNPIKNIFSSPLSSIFGALATMFVVRQLANYTQGNALNNIQNAGTTPAPPQSSFKLPEVINTIENRIRVNHFLEKVDNVENWVAKKAQPFIATGSAMKYTTEKQPLAVAGGIFGATKLGALGALGLTALCPALGVFAPIVGGAAGGLAGLGIGSGAGYITQKAPAAVAGGVGLWKGALTASLLASIPFVGPFMTPLVGSALGGLGLYKAVSSMFGKKE